MRIAGWLVGGLSLLPVACNSPSPADAPKPAKATPTPGKATVKTPAEVSAGADPVHASGYRLPSSDVVEIVDAPPTPRVSVSPDGEWLGLFTREALPGIDLVTRPFERLAGLRIDAQRHARRRTRWISAVSLEPLGEGAKVDVSLPAGSRITWPVWSPDGAHLAFTRDGNSGLELWVASVADGKAKRLGTMKVNDILGSPFMWMPGSKALLVRQVPPELGAPPARPTVPRGPVVQDTAGKAAQNRTYQDLLANAADEDAFEHFATSQLVIIDLEGQSRTLGSPGLLSGAEPSPDGQYVLVERIHRPFSYTVPYYRFPRIIEVLDPKAKVVRRVADQEVADQIPIQGVRTGPRSVHWQPERPATLVWTEALDGGDPRKKAEHRDRLMSHAAPFADTPEERLRVEHRLSGVSWTERSGQVLVREYDRDRRWITTRLHELDDKSFEPKVLFDRSVRDVYADAGRPVTKVLPDGSEVVIVHEGNIYLDGAGASPEGNRPFLDRYELATGTTQRLLQSEGESHTEFIDLLGEKRDAFVVSRQSAQSPPNIFVEDEAGSRQITELADPHPQLTGISKKILRYTRRDGVPLSGELYLPPDYEEGQRLPLVIWAYPLEYNDGDTAGQVRAAPRRFTRLAGTSPLMFLTQGYAVLSNAAMPIVGDPKTMNDNFIDQVVWSAEAAIDAAVESGAADRDRVGVAGHSYGAFMTANLLAHSDLFRAGIARSGAYNRSLTPFGFQSERRTLWEATDTYVAVSPLFSAHKIDEPLLMVHGEVDNNSGTYPLQSRRLFRALEGNGGTARLVMLPGESHGYSARESVLHVLAESFEWFDAHVKNAEPSGGKKPAPVALADTPSEPTKAPAGEEPKAKDEAKADAKAKEEQEPKAEPAEEPKPAAAAPAPAEEPKAPKAEPKPAEETPSGP